MLDHLEAIKEEHEISTEILGKNPDSSIPGLEGPRAKCCYDGIFSSDVILVPLEDGDRCEALVNMGKTVIVIDLNPLSRSARKASITIVDEVSRVARNMLELIKNGDELEIDNNFSNDDNLQQSLNIIASNYTSDIDK